MRRTLLVVTAAITLHVTGAAQSRFDLTIPKIMRGAENTGREPSGIRWSPDGRWIYFQWLPPGTDWKETLKPYRVRPAPGAVPERLSQAAADSLEPMIAEGPLSPDRKRRGVSVRGAPFLVELPRGRVRRLTDTPAMQELDPSFDREGRRVLFRRDNNVLALDIVQGGVQQLTDIRPGPAPEEPKPAVGQRGFVEREERTPARGGQARGGGARGGAWGADPRGGGAGRAGGATAWRGRSARPARRGGPGRSTWRRASRWPSSIRPRPGTRCWCACSRRPRTRARRRSRATSPSRGTPKSCRPAPRWATRRPRSGSACSPWRPVRSNGSAPSPETPPAGTRASPSGGGTTPAPRRWSSRGAATTRRATWSAWMPAPRGLPRSTSSATRRGPAARSAARATAGGGGAPRRPP